VALGHDQTRCTEYSSRAQNGADVVRIGHLIEDDERSGGAAGAVNEVGETGLGQRSRFGHDALMHRIGTKNAVQILGADALGCEAPVGDRVGKAPLRILSDEQPNNLPLRIGESR